MVTAKLIEPRRFDLNPDWVSLMDDFVAHPSRWRIALLILGAFAFVVLGLWMLGAFGLPPTSERHSPSFMLALGWSSVVFFGLCGLAWIRRLFDGREQLRIGPAGVQSARWSEETIPWSEITDVTIWSYKRQKTIVLHLRDRARFPGRGIAALLAGASRSMTGGDISISLTGTNRSFADALASIERFRARAP